ncbi:MAG: general secretion pathway protein GspB [Pseudomonadota bacterium]
MRRHLDLPATVLTALLAFACVCASAQEQKEEVSEREMARMIELAEEADKLGITPQELEERRSGVQRVEKEAVVEQPQPVAEPRPVAAPPRPARSGPAVQVVQPDAADETPRQVERGARRSARESFDEVPLWYQLPLRVREELPELDMTLHYFTEEPAERFVKLNGERFAEGDQVQSRLRVRAIRRDGVVLEFRNDVFLLGRR